MASGKKAARYIIAAQVKADLYGALKLRAELEDRTLSAIFRRALVQFLSSPARSAEEVDRVAS